MKKTITLALSAILTACTLFMTGCHDETKNIDKCVLLAKATGTTVGYVIKANLNGTSETDTVKTIIAVMNTIATSLPSNVTFTALAADLKIISTNAVHNAFPEIYDNHTHVVEQSVDALLSFLQSTLTTVGEKYPTEFNNAEMFYQIAYVFFDSASSVVRDMPSTDEPRNDSITPFFISPVSYADLVNEANSKLDEILSEEDFNTLMTQIGVMQQLAD